MIKEEAPASQLMPVVESSQPAAGVDMMVVETQKDGEQKSAVAAGEAGHDGSDGKEDAAATATQAGADEEKKKKKKEGVVTLGAALLFKALRVPSTDARDPLGCLFPSDELLEELVASSST